MLTTQARLAKRNNQPVKLVGDLYHIIDIKRVNGTSHLIGYAVFGLFVLLMFGAV